MQDSIVDVSGFFQCPWASMDFHGPLHGSVRGISVINQVNVKPDALAVGNDMSNRRFDWPTESQQVRTPLSKIGWPHRERVGTKQEDICPQHHTTSIISCNIFLSGCPCLTQWSSMITHGTFTHFGTINIFHFPIRLSAWRCCRAYENKQTKRKKTDVLSKGRPQRSHFSWTRLSAL